MDRIVTVSDPAIGTQAAPAKLSEERRLGTRDRIRNLQKEEVNQVCKSTKQHLSRIASELPEDEEKLRSLVDALLAEVMKTQESLQECK